MVRIATWNLENLFAPGGQAGPETTVEFDAKANALATTIGRMAPDVLAAQEVGSPCTVNSLRSSVPVTRAE
ncbi:hypothetical protein SAMN04488550_0046 [Gordonia malaquae]|uniref:Endonuclease/exonuclease/phosphatase domain-containing protein n=1 Tax=Gordonia malaquae NBRC 108250 TaxID=1223542 RepID=M3V0P8_GORML|nr:hypothetical protein [Gordonia malaquae]GAC82077.1 hypothetical protein GM1_067_00040 [Gordonia malaquae NBRC 108250]SEB29865.1 hypothetical protein SAMN04488550_0046 [Gordonia malaquae]